MRSIACAQTHPGERDIEFFGGHLELNDADALAEFDLARVDRDAAIRFNSDPSREDGVGGKIRMQRGVPGHLAHAASLRMTAARRAARRIRMCAAQRQRCRSSAAMSSFSVGSALCASSAASDIMMPSEQ